MKEESQLQFILLLINNAGYYGTFHKSHLKKTLKIVSEYGLHINFRAFFLMMLGELSGVVFLYVKKLKF